MAVVGAGAWGTALAKVLAEQDNSVRLWSWQAEHADRLQRTRTNELLPEARLPDPVWCTADLAAALDGASFAIFVVPSHGLREIVLRAKPLLSSQTELLSATKGIETGTLMLMTEVMEDVLGSGTSERLACLSGPSFAREVAERLPTNVVVAGTSSELCARVQQLFATDWLRVYSNHDLVGVEMGGAIKNVIAIAAGACDGLGFGTNTRAALITRGLAEITRLAVAKGGAERTLAGLSGMGDLVLTCTGELSRNRSLGYAMGRGQSLAAALQELGHVAEGVPTAESTYHLAARLGVEMPICNEVYRVLFEGKDVKQAVRDLLTRPLKTEWG